MQCMHSMYLMCYEHSQQLMLVKGMQPQKAKTKNVCEAQTSAAVLFKLMVWWAHICAVVCL